MTPREVLIQQYRKRIRPPAGEWMNKKPPACAQDCGDRLQKPRSRVPQARAEFRCGLGTSSQCPVRKSINRIRSKIRKRQLGLWRRSVRVYWERLNAQAVELDYPRNYPSGYPRGYPSSHPTAEEVFTKYPETARMDKEIFIELRKDLDMTEALDVYLMLARPLEERTNEQRSDTNETTHPWVQLLLGTPQES